MNTPSYVNEGEAELKTVLSIELKAGIEVKAAIVIVIGEAYFKAEASAKGKASVTFGHGLYYKQVNSKNRELYYAPKLNFDGLKVSAVIKTEIGLLIKKGWFKGDYDGDLLDYKTKKTLFCPF